MFTTPRSFGCLLVTLGLFVVLTLAIVIGTGLQSATSSGGAAAAPDAAWYPSDYTLTPQDTDVAYRWLTEGELTCPGLGGSCWGMYVIPRKGCPTLYVELSVQDAGGTVVGLANDLASGVQAGQRARLTFSAFSPGAAKARISKVSCF